MQFVDGLMGNDPDTGLYNSNGHRCKELSELNLQNYILFVGDNANLALDLPIEKTYPYLIANELKSDYYNLSVFNGGMDSIRYNLVSWYFKFKQRPKAIIAGCEFLNSIIVSDTDNTYFKSADYNDDAIQELSHNGNICGFFNGRNELANNIFYHLIYTPIYQIRFKEKLPIFTSEKVIDIKCEFNDQVGIATSISNEIKKRSTQARP